MRKILKIAGAVCLIVMSLFNFSCGESAEKSDSTEKDDFPYRTAKTDVKTDGQLYADGFLNMPSYLWTERKTKDYGELDKGTAKGIFVETLENEYAFAFVALPENASKDNKVPAVVLVHGATGTAFYDWAVAWAEKGYAAIAMDTEGKMPTEQTGINNSNYADYRQSVENHGPEQSHFTDYANDVTSQWSYHALAAVIACTTYISSLDCVDAARVGVTGVSYGGYLTCLAAAYDDRYAFAIPVYGTLANRYGSGPFAGYINSNKAYGLDDENQLSLNRTPMLMVTSENDTHFSLNSTLRTAKAAKADICVVPGLTHGHNQCLGVPEIFAFADEICFGKTPTIRIISPADETGYMKVALPKGVNVAGADYYYTFDENLNAETIWNTIACDVNGGEIFAAADVKHKNGFILVKDSRGYRLASFTKTSDPIDN